MFEAAGPVQEARLDTGITPGCRISRVLAGWLWLDVVLAVQSQPLDDLERAARVRPRGSALPQGTQLTPPQECSPSRLTTRTAGTIWSVGSQLLQPCSTLLLFQPLAQLSSFHLSGLALLAFGIRRHSDNRTFISAVL